MPARLLKVLAFSQPFCYCHFSEDLVLDYSEYRLSA